MESYKFSLLSDASSTYHQFVFPNKSISGVADAAFATSFAIAFWVGVPEVCHLSILMADFA